MFRRVSSYNPFRTASEKEGKCGHGRWNGLPLTRITELAPHLFLNACADVFLAFELHASKCPMKLKNKNQGTRYFLSQSLCFVPQCYDYKRCCHLWYFVLFVGFSLYPAWLASVECVGCFSFQFKKEAAFLLVCLNLLQLSSLVVGWHL